MYVFFTVLSSFIYLCSKRGFDVRSFGTGSHVKLPGPAPDKPNVYDFKTTYVQMYNDLVRKDKELYPLLTHLSTHMHILYTGSQISKHGPCPCIFFSYDSLSAIMQSRWHLNGTADGIASMGKSHVGILKNVTRIIFYFIYFFFFKTLNL